MSFILRDRATKIGFSPSKNAVGDDYTIKTSFIYFIDVVMKLLLEKRDVITAYSPFYLERLFGFMLKVAPEQTFINFYDHEDNLLNNIKHFCYVKSYYPNGF